MKIKLAKSEIIHFVGIGGIGMSGLSLIMKGKGFKVQGSDISSNKNIERLKKEKIKISIGHKKQNINKATIVVVGSHGKTTTTSLIASIFQETKIDPTASKTDQSLLPNFAELFIELITPPLIIVGSILVS